MREISFRAAHNNKSVNYRGNKLGDNTWQQHEQIAGAHFETLHQPWGVLPRFLLNRNPSQQPTDASTLPPCDPRATLHSARTTVPSHRDGVAESLQP